ncbi:MAG: diguanylate cyclase, partial [Natronospirillum sp.]
MPIASNPPITSAKLLLDRDFRLISIDDSRNLLTPPPQAGQLLGEYWPEFNHWLAQYQAVDFNCNNFQACIPGTMATLTPLGDWQLLHIIGTVADACALKRSEEARERAESDYENLFHTAQAGLYQSTIGGTFLRVNHLFARTLGCASREECMAYYNDITLKLYDNPRQRLRLLSIFQRDGCVVNERARLVRRDGNPVWVLINAQYMTERHTGREVIQGSIIDITEQVNAENEIRYLAEHDALTRLPNRSQFQQQLQQAYDHWQQHLQDEFSVIFLDLDHFKDINDTLGHLVGDALLIELAQRLQQPLNAPCKTFRLGGDEFAILVDRALSETDLDILCFQIADRVSREYRYQDSVLKVTASMGVVQCHQLDADR